MAADEIYNSKTDLKKVAVVGVSCSGKTTFSAKLSKIIDAKAVDIDEIHWKPNWVSTVREELIPKVVKELQCSKWVVSGNYSCVQEYIFNEADTIIWLDYSPFIVGKRALTRTLKAVILKRPCCNGNYETFKQSFLSKNSILLWVIQTYKKRKNQYQQAMNENDKFLRFGTPQEAHKFLSSLN